MAATRMDGLEIGAFLDDHATGVLSLARDDEGYAVPVSFAYDPDDGAVYCRLGYGEDSTKRRFVEAAEVASLVVHDDGDHPYRSVVVRGPIEELTDGTLDAAVLEASWGLTIPSRRVAAEDDPEFAVVRLTAREVTGITERE